MFCDPDDDDAPLDFDTDVEEDDGFAQALRASDALVAMAELGLNRIAYLDCYLIHDEDWDKIGRITEWLSVVDATRELPATLAAVIVDDACNSLEPLQHERWVGRLIVAAAWRGRAKTHGHLA